MLCTLTATDDTDALLAGPSPVLIFKHSPTCGISRAASIEVSMFSEERPDVRIVLVDVLRERTRSKELAAVLGIRHESPQALLVTDGRVRWHASHGGITHQAISSACDALAAHARTR